MKKSSLFKFISGALAIFLLCPLLASCANNSGTTPTDTDDDAVTDVQTSIEDTLKMDVNYEDYSFNIYLSAQGGRTPNDFKYTDITKVMDSARYKKNALVEKNYGVVISCDEELSVSHGGKAYEKIFRQYASSETDYDMLLVNGYDTSNLALEGCLYDIETLPNINTSNSWWDQSAKRDLTISGSLYYTHGALSTINDDFTFCVVFNKDLYKSIIGQSTDQLYQLVEDGKWTFDKLDELAKVGAKDLNGDQTMDSRDMFGLMLWDSELNASINAVGNKFASINEDGKVELTLYSEKTNEVVNKMVTIGHSDYAYNFQHPSGNVAWYDMFTQNQVLFFMSMFNEVERFRDMQTDYGIIPNPKLDEESPYYAPVSNWHSAFISVPAMIDDEDKVSNIIELLGYHSEKTLSPAYYEKTLKGTYVRDDESVDMLDIILGNRIYDVGFLYLVGELPQKVTQLIVNNNPGGLASVYQSTLNNANSDIRALNQRIEVLKNS